MSELIGILDSLKAVNKDLCETCNDLDIIGKEIDEKDLPNDAEIIDQPEEGKPFPNEYSCRLKSPTGYDRFRRANCFKRSGGKCIDFIFGIKGGKAEAQALRYKKSIWTRAQAKSHCSARSHLIFE